MIVRRVPSPDPNRNPARIAATGGTVAARRAGVSDASIVTPIPTIRATMIVRGAMMMSMLGKVRPSAAHHAAQPERQQHTAAEPEDRGDHADDQRLEQRAEPHLRTARPECSQQGELADPLTEQDVERVADDEDADEHGDQRERQQHVAEDVDEERRSRPCPRRRRRHRSPPRHRRQHRLEPIDQHLRLDALLGRDVDYRIWPSLPSSRWSSSSVNDISTAPASAFSSPNRLIPTSSNGSRPLMPTMS